MMNKIKACIGTKICRFVVGMYVCVVVGMCVRVGMFGICVILGSGYV